MDLVVNLNKPSGITSHDAVLQVKKAFKVRKAGHAGTLDPLAEGVLVVCLNEATKITNYLCDTDKEYITTAKLGETTDTYDKEGKITKTCDCNSLKASHIEEILAEFTGLIKQTPPAYSAIKVAGTPAYELARQGKDIKLSKREVFVQSIELLDFDNPYFTLKVKCQKGVYIRSLIHDIGQRLNVGAHIVKLIRSKVGIFTLDQSATLHELPLKLTAIYTIDTALADIPSVILTEVQAQKILHGQRLPFEHEDCAVLKAKDSSGRLIALCRCLKNTLQVKRLIAKC